MHKYTVYILESLKNGRYYVGYSNDLEKRIKQHNSGYTKGSRHLAPFKLVYKEEFDNLTDAVRRELYIKKQKSRKFIRGLINLGL